MSLPWTSDEELFARARRELFSAVIGDTLDLLGHRHQFLPPEVQPLRDDMVVVGRAMPVLEADDEIGKAQTRAGEVASPFGLMLRALDDLKPGEVYVCAGSSRTYASWGELMTMSARNRGATGVVIDGWSRDTPCGPQRRVSVLLARAVCAGSTDPRHRRRFPLPCPDRRRRHPSRRCHLRRPGRRRSDSARDRNGGLRGRVVEGPWREARVRGHRGGLSAQEAWDRYGIF
jgi:hypothetical protein